MGNLANQTSLHEAKLFCFQNGSPRSVVLVEDNIIDDCDKKFQCKLKQKHPFSWNLNLDESKVSDP
jgi:hypothetical protein